MSTKIVIVAGQQFSVPAETENEAVRQQLLSMGFADVASASLKTSTRTLEGQEVPVIEFVKTAGTKGLDGADLASLLARVPRIAIAAPDASLLAMADALLTGTLTVDEALERSCLDALDAIATATSDIPHTDGGKLCRTLAHTRAVAAAVDVW